MTVVTDNFNRATESPIQSPWVVVANTPGISSANTFEGQGGGTVRNCARYGGSGIGADQYSQATVPVISNTGGDRQPGVCVRCSSSDVSFYWFRADSATSSIVKYIAGAATTIASAGAAFVANDTIYLQVIGTQLIAKINGATIFTITDSSIATGDPGLAIQNNNVTRLDNFEAGDIGGGGGGVTTVQLDRMLPRGLLRGLNRGL